MRACGHGAGKVESACVGGDAGDRIALLAGLQEDAEIVRPIRCVECPED